MAVASLLTFGAAPAIADSCPNAQYRTGYSAYLPDCRAYEQVTPVNKGGNDATIASLAFADAVTFDGNSMAYGAPTDYDPTSGSNMVLNTYIATRSSSGWSDRSVEPPFTNAGNNLPQYTYVAWSSDLQHMVAMYQAFVPNSSALSIRNPDGSFLQIPAAPSALPVQYEGASSDFSHVAFHAYAPLTSNAPAFGGVYEWNGGQISLVSVLPDGTPVSGQGILYQLGDHPVSADGSHVLWGYNGGLYQTDNGASAELSTSQCSTGVTGQSGPGGNCVPAGSAARGTFQAASADGSTVFFTSTSELTNDANTGTSDQGNDLYKFDSQTGALVDLTPDSAVSDSSGADVLGVVGASSDAGYVYFVADGVLATGATGGSPNLYGWHNGTTTFIGRLSPNDSVDWGTGGFSEGPLSVAQVAADGSDLVFASSANLTGYDSAGHSEIYRYDSASGQLICVSCDPSGAAATSDAALGAHLLEYQAVEPGSISSDGSRVFFETADPLVPQATNGLQDVYEWEADGTGGCQSTADNGGCLYLVSSGQSPSGSYFMGSSPSGNDVFFLTRSQLVGQDTDDLYDIYDARVDGGLAGQSQSPQSPCQGQGCKPPMSAAAPPPTIGTVAFSGPGNASARPKAKILTRVAHGTVFFIRVKVPMKGGVTINGAGVRTVRRWIARAGTFRLKVVMNKNARRRLKRKRSARLRLRVHVRYAPPGGSPAMETVMLTVKRGGAR